MCWERIIKLFYEMKMGTEVSAIFSKLYYLYKTIVHNLNTVKSFYYSYNFMNFYLFLWDIKFCLVEVFINKYKWVSVLIIIVSYLSYNSLSMKDN